jgi:hypothetical protein
VRLDGNDYLSVTGHPDIVQAQLASIRSDREFVLQSGVFQLEGNSHWSLERALCEWLGWKTACFASPGYTANLGLLQVVADPQTPVYMDSLAHMSLWEGARAANAPVHAFRHNDPAHLAKMMARHGPGLVVVDSVYSTTGALCPLREIVEAAEMAGSMILVDESHSLGTHGPAGAGLCAQLGLTDRVQFITCSLAKAFAGRAGFFSMPRSCATTDVPQLPEHLQLLPAAARSGGAARHAGGGQAQRRCAPQAVRATPAACAPACSDAGIRSTRAASRSSRWKRAPSRRHGAARRSWRRGRDRHRSSARRPPARTARWCA